MTPTNFARMAGTGGVLSSSVRKMRKSLGIVPVLLLFAALIAPNAHADTVTDYTITFALRGTMYGTINASSGAFTYDDTSSQFTRFTLLWDGILFDLTSGANAPTIDTGGPFGPLPGCLTSTSGAAASLSLLTSCSTDPESFWGAALCATCGPRKFRVWGLWDGHSPRVIRRGNRFRRGRVRWMHMRNSSLRRHMVHHKRRKLFDDTRAGFPRPHSARDRVSLYDAKADRSGPSTGTLNGPLTSTSRTPSATVLACRVFGNRPRRYGVRVTTRA
jgi:hypothetical protein